MSTYDSFMENCVQINGYYFDMGANRLENPSSEYIYVASKYHPDDINILIKLGLEQIEVGSYVVFFKDLTT